MPPSRSTSRTPFRFPAEKNQRTVSFSRHLTSYGVSPRHDGWFIPSICVQGGADAVQPAAVRCPITAQHALGPTDGQDGLGQGLLHHSTRAASFLGALWEGGNDRGKSWRCCRWISHHFGTRVWAFKAQNLRVGTPSHVWQKLPGRLSASHWEASREASHDGGMLHTDKVHARTAPSREAEEVVLGSSCEKYG